MFWKYTIWTVNDLTARVSRFKGSSYFTAQFDEDCACLYISDAGLLYTNFSNRYTALYFNYDLNGTQCYQLRIHPKKIYLDYVTMPLSYYFVLYLIIVNKQQFVIFLQHHCTYRVFSYTFWNKFTKYLF